MRVIIYIRVSTKLQGTKFSLEGQRDDLTKYAKDQGWTIVDTLVDVDSGGKLDKKGLNALLDSVEDGLADIVLVVEQDRLSRLDTLEWEFLKGVLRDNKVKIAEPGVLTDLSNEDDEFVSDLKNLIAKRGKKAMVRQMMRGKRRKMREGESFGKGPFEYVYIKETKKFKIIEGWHWVIPFIDDLYLNKQFGMVSIAKKLNEISKTPTGNYWNEKLVHTRLISKAYHGIDEKTFESGETIAAKGVYEAVRTEETYNKIQIERKKRGKFYSVYTREYDRLHLFRRTLFTCGECGRKIGLLQHGTKKTPRFYLKHGRPKSAANQTVCDISINTIRIEPQVRDALKDILRGEEFASRYIALGMHEEDIQRLNKTLNSLEVKINEEELKKGRLLDLFLDGIFDKKMLEDKQDEIEKSLEALHKQKTELESKLKLLQSESWGYDMIYNFMAILDDFETLLTPLEQAQTFGGLFPTATLYYDRLTLTTMIDGAPVDFNVPIADDPYLWHKSKKRG